MGMYKTPLMWSFIHTHVYIMCAGYEYCDNTHNQPHNNNIRTIVCSCSPCTTLTLNNFLVLLAMNDSNTILLSLKTRKRPSIELQNKISGNCPHISEVMGKFLSDILNNYCYWQLPSLLPLASCLLLAPQC